MRVTFPGVGFLPAADAVAGVMPKISMTARSIARRLFKFFFMKILLAVIKQNDIGFECCKGVVFLIQPQLSLWYFQQTPKWNL